jgi:hypothetical protein
MKCSPQNLSQRLKLLTCVTFAASAVLWHGVLTAQSAEESSQPPNDTGVANPPDGPAAGQNDPEATEILNDVKQKLDELDSLSCDLHQIVSYSGMKVVAAGRYVQASGNRVRLEFRLFPAMTTKSTDRIPASPDGEQSAEDDEPDLRGTFVQVSDGIVLHTLFENGGQIRVTRKNIRDVLTAAGDSKSYGTDAALRDLGVGGIKALLGRIQSDMEFAPVQRSTAGGTQMYRLTGRWTAEALARLFNAPADTAILPAEHLPEYVRILIDAESSLPRRIQFLKRNADPEAGVVRPIVTLDFRSIELNKNIDDSMFAFSPPEGVTEEDVTDQTIDLINQLSAAPVATVPERSAP